MTERRNDGTTEGQGESSIAPLFQSGAITKVLISCADTVQQNCFFGFSYAECWFSDVAAHNIHHL